MLVRLFTCLLALSVGVTSTGAVASDDGYLANQKKAQFTRISMEDGLSQAFVSSITQDPKGFVWIGTQEGLNRYDGIHFETYYSDSADPTSLSHNSVWSLFVDSKDRFWIGTGLGLDLYQPDSDSFEKISGPTSEVRVLFEDSAGSVWIGTSDGLWKIDENLSVFRIAEDVLHPQNSGGIRGFAQLSQNEFLIGSERNGVYRYNQTTYDLSAFDRDAAGQPITADNHIRDLLVDSGGDIWIATFNGGLSRVYADSRLAEVISPTGISDYGLSSNRVRKLYLDSASNLWAGTDGGLHLWSEELRRFFRFEHDRTDPRSIGDNFIVDIFEDKGGVLWVGTFNGVNKWNSKVEMFPYFKRPYSASDVLPGDNVTSFVGDNLGNVWVGTLEGMMFWDSSQSQLRSLSSSELGLVDTRVMSLELLDNQVWVGTMAGGINVIENGVVVENYRYDPLDSSSLSSNAVPELYVDSKNRVWVGTYGGGLNLYLGNDRFKRFPVTGDAATGFPVGRCLDVIEDSEGSIWIATEGGGVVRLDPETEEVITYRANVGGQPSLSSDNVVTLLPTEAGVWVGTLNDGLNLLSPRDGKVETFSRSDGLASDSIYGLLDDADGNIWISSAKGLSLLRLPDRTFVTFDSSHGLQGSDFNSGAYRKLHDGSFLFGGSQGFNAFYPDRISVNEFVPPVEITGFKLFNQTKSLRDMLNADDVIDLEYNQSVIGFLFAALDYTAPSKNQYRYKLEGFDRDWVHHQGIREATYTNLDAGEYVFRVQGSNNDGVWNEEGASLSLVVHPAPWFTWWAYTVYLLVVGVAFFFVFRFNSDRLKREAERRYSERLQLYIESLEEASDCILIADSSGTLLYANNTITEGLNKSPSEVVGESLWKVLFEHEIDVELAQESLATEGRYHGEVQLEGIDGDPVTHEVTIAAVQQSSTYDPAYVGISRDVTDRKITEAELEDYRKNLEILVEERTAALQKEIAENKEIQVQLEDSLQEKELLIKEVHHRVKNNMQVISSLLSIQAEGEQDDIYSDLLNESQQRIKSMALIHETLYQSKDLLKIDFQEYIETLTTSLSRSYRVPGVSVHVAVSVDDVALDLETAVPCGLIINELVSNALKHAFRGMQGTGIIDINFVSNDSDYELRISDNGCGLPIDFDPNKKMSMGMEIVSILTTQLEGKLKSHNQEGAVFDIRFPRRTHA